MELNLKIIVVIAAIITIIGTGAIYYYAVINKTRAHTVAIEVVGNGRVLLGEAGAYTTIIQVNDGESLKIEAQPDLGWTFNQWSGDLSGSINPNNIIVTKDLNITAVFTK